MPPREPLISFTVSSVVDAPADAVWARVTTMEGVNHELMPIVRMTVPRALRSFTIDDAPLGERVFRSWILLFGVLPIDGHDLTLVSIDPRRGFHEHSSSLAQREWIHRRTLEPVAGGTRVTDQIGCTPRMAFLAPLLRPVFQAIFRHRHRRLARHFAPGQTRWNAGGRARR
jgi:ligand-binding SRPBCC domain-containing protein